MHPEFGIRSFALLFEFISFAGLLYTFWADIAWQAIIREHLGNIALVGEKQSQKYTHTNTKHQADYLKRMTYLCES
jgi:hypothetical protein